MNEAERQRGLLRALGFGAVAGADAAAFEAPSVAPLWRESGARAARGLEAYRANAETIAERALASSFPTVQAMVGEADFRPLARAFWHAHPASRGDLGEWGEALPEWLAAQPSLADWPWLADSARLDLALHRCERAADESLDAASLAQLESHDPSRLRLELVAGSALVRSAWPVASIHAAHQLEAGAAADAAFEGVRERVAAGDGERAFVVRHGWRARVHPLGARDAAWTDDLLRGASLADALERAGEGFDFAAWLGLALRESWLKGVAASGD